MSKHLFFIAIAILLAGCLELEQKIVLSSDGSAVFTFIYDIPNENLPAVEGFFAAQTPPDGGFLSESAVKKFYNRPQDGIELRGYRRIKKDNHTIVQVIVLARNMDKAMKTDCFPSVEYTKKTKETPGRLELKLPKLPENASEADLKQVANFCKGLKLTCEFQTPANIEKISKFGHQSSSRRAVWHFSADTAAAPIYKPLPPAYVEW
ncbi:MAG: hypothetical protein K5787_06435 [Lentisphaeria bacterium]|nr:hypothetical protein [Lentisphaeria bacterium]